MALSLTLTIITPASQWYGAAADDGTGETLREGMIDVHTDLTAIKTLLEATDLDDFDALPALSGAGVGGRFVKTTAAGTALEFVAGSSATHAADHIQGGADEVDGDLLDIDYAETNYTPATAGVATDVNHLAAHLEGIDVKLAEIAAIGVAGQTTEPNLLTGTTPTAGGDIDMAGNDIVGTNDVAIEIDNIPAGGGGVRVRSLGDNVSGFTARGDEANIDLVFNGKGSGRTKIAGGWVGNANAASVRKDIDAVSATYPVVADDDLGSGALTDEGKVLICTGGAYTVTLPDTPKDGFTVTIVSNTASTTTVAAGGTVDTILGSATKSLAAQYTHATFVYQLASTTWFVIAGAVT